MARALREGIRPPVVREAMGGGHGGGARHRAARHATRAARPPRPPKGVAPEVGRGRGSPHVPQPRHAVRARRRRVATCAGAHVNVSFGLHRGRALNITPRGR
eukprot:676999-Prorocentrum_minimum.AAC.1